MLPRHETARREFPRLLPRPREARNVHVSSESEREMAPQYFFLPPPDILILEHDSSILKQSSNPVCGFSVMEQVKVCAVWPRGNWLSSSMNHIQWSAVTVTAVTVTVGYSDCFCNPRFIRTKIQVVTVTKNWLQWHNKLQNDPYLCKIHQNLDGIWPKIGNSPFSMHCKNRDAQIWW